MFNFVFSPHLFTPGKIFIKLWSNVRHIEMVCITNDSTCWLKVTVTIEVMSLSLQFFMSAPDLLYGRKDFHKIKVLLLEQCDDVQNL